MYERTRITFSLLADRPLTPEEAGRCVTQFVRSVDVLEQTDVQLRGAVTVEQTTVLSDE